MQWYWRGLDNSHSNQEDITLSWPEVWYLYPKIVLVFISLKKITEFSLELDTSFKSFVNNLDTTLLCSTTVGSPSLRMLDISKNLLYLLALSKKPTVVPNDIGLVALLKL